MKKCLFVLFVASVALSASASVKAKSMASLTKEAGNERLLGTVKATEAPYDMYLEPGTTSCLVTWQDDYNSAWNLRYRVYSDEPDEPVLLHSLDGTTYTGNYVDIVLPEPWGGVNTRGGNGAIYIKNNYNGVETGTLTYTIPEGYTDATFTLLITSGTGSYGTGNFTVYTPQTADVTHYFTGSETYKWVVTASSGEQITVYSTDESYSPDIALIEVYSGDATEMTLKANAWNYVRNIERMAYTIEDLEMDTEYEVQVQGIGDDGTVSEWGKSDNFITLVEEPIIPVVHVLGEIDDQVWSPSSATKMDYDAETETYTVTFFIWEDRTFGFTTEIDDNEDMGGWNYINPYRFGPVSEDGSDILLTTDVMGQRLPLTFDNYGNLQALTAGEYQVTVSLEENYVIIGKISEPVHGYQVGDVNHDNAVSIKDVTDLIDYLLGSDNGACPICSDVNGDGSVAISDVTALIDTLLGGN